MNCLDHSLFWWIVVGSFFMLFTLWIFSVGYFHGKYGNGVKH